LWGELLVKYFFKKLLLIAVVCNADAVQLQASASSGVATSAIESLSLLMPATLAAAATIAVNLLSPRHQRVGVFNDRPSAEIAGKAGSAVTACSSGNGHSVDVSWFNFDFEAAGSRSDESLVGLANDDQDDETWLKNFFGCSESDDSLGGSKSPGLDDELLLGDVLPQDRSAVVHLPTPEIDPLPASATSPTVGSDRGSADPVSTSSTAFESAAESSSFLHKNEHRNARPVSVESAALFVNAAQASTSPVRGNKNLTRWQKDLFYTIKCGSAKQIQEILNKRPVDDTFELAFLSRRCFSPLKVACRRRMQHVEVLLRSGLRLHEDDTSSLFQYLRDKIKISSTKNPYVRKRNKRYKNIMTLLKKDIRFICIENSAKATTNNVGNGVKGSNVWKLANWQQNVFKIITRGDEQNLQEYLKQGPVGDTAGLAFFNYNKCSPLKAACSYSVNSVKILLSSGLKLAEEDASGLFEYLNGKIETARSSVGANRYRKIQKLLQEDGRFTCADELTADDLSSFSHDNSKRNALSASAASQVVSERAARASAGFSRRVKNSMFKGLTIWQQNLFNMIRYGTSHNVEVCLKQRPDDDTAELDFFNNKNLSPLKTACSYNLYTVKLLLSSGLRLHEDDTSGLFAYLNSKTKNSHKSFLFIDRYREIQKLLREDGRFTCTDDLTAADSGGGAAAIVPKLPAKRSAIAASSSVAHPVASVQKVKRPKAKATKANAGGASGTGTDSQGEDDDKL
jgi:hypothetical protein